MILTVYFSLWVTFSGFYPTYLVEAKGMSATTAGILFGVFFALGVVVKPLAGVAFDHVDVGRTFVVVGGVSGTALFVLPLVRSLLVLVLLTILVAPVLGSGTIATALMLEELPGDIQGTGFGVIRTFTLTAAAMAPILFGSFADRGFFDESFVVLGALAWMMVPLALLVSRA